LIPSDPLVKISDLFLVISTVLCKIKGYLANPVNPVKERKMKSHKGIKRRSQADESLLKQVEQQIHSIVPDAEFILYGSHARGDAGPTSDWHFLILVNQPLDRDRIVELKNRLYDLELKTDTVLTSIVRARDEWNSPRYSALPFKRALEQEGVSHCD
jgi:predicted nucleotidyltransferase